VHAAKWAEDRRELQERYLELTRHELPARAARDHWRLSEDHCFMRIILDQLFQDCWYDHLDKRLPAYKQLNNDQLRKAIEFAQQILSEGYPLLNRWNFESLQWRIAYRRRIKS